ncbi:MAG: hypothetical protein QXJ74_01545 [Nitrososphaera sp.]
MLGLFQKHCPVCGMDVDRESAVKRFGRYFCSEEHGKQYAEMKMSRDAGRKEDSGHGGCC